jgi:hypothetical protein
MLGEGRVAAAQDLAALGTVRAGATARTERPCSQQTCDCIGGAGLRQLHQHFRVLLVSEIDRSGRHRPPRGARTRPVERLARRGGSSPSDRAATGSRCHGVPKFPPDRGELIRLARPAPFDCCCGTICRPTSPCINLTPLSLDRRVLPAAIHLRAETGAHEGRRQPCAAERVAEALCEGS